MPASRFRSLAGIRVFSQPRSRLADRGPPKFLHIAGNVQPSAVVKTLVGFNAVRLSSQNSGGISVRRKRLTNETGGTLCANEIAASHWTDCSGRCCAASPTDERGRLLVYVAARLLELK